MDYENEQMGKMPDQSEKWPEGGLEDVPCCPICDTSERRLLYSGLTDRIFFCAPGEWSLYQCRGCGAGYLDPRPTPDTINIAYQGYYTHASPQKTASQAPGLVHRLESFLVNSYWKYYYGHKLQPVPVMAALLMRRISRFRNILDRNARYLPPAIAGGRLLDVGFGGGHFLNFASKQGWRVAGVDTDPVVVANARARGMDVREGGVEAFEDQPESFDVVTMSHVIEHAHEPKKMLRQAFRLLKPKGHLYLETPNIEAAGHKEFGEYWRGLEPPRHLTVFSWAGLENLLARIGFDIIRQPCAPNIYPKLAAKSRAIMHGQDPEKEEEKRDPGRPGIIFVKMKRVGHYRNCEFVTLTARKPG